MNKLSILLPIQYGFRANHSTIHALLDVITSFYDNIKNSKFTALVLLDLRKAFDTVYHNILSNKLEQYGIRGVAHKFFSSFLSNRCQYVSLNNKQSTCRKNTCGVPRGSLLGPLLFTLYINDINSSTSDCPKLFADDTCLILQDNTLNHLYNKVSSEISSVNKWMVANKLTLKLEKSNVIIINPKNCLIGTKPNTVSIHQHVLPSLSTVTAAKYLGVLDDGLSFKTHINMLTKISRAVGVLSKVKLFLNKSSLLSLYYGIFHSHLQYGILAWSANYKSYYNKIAIGGGKWNDRATPFYAKLNILKLNDLIHFEKACFLFKHKFHKLPCVFNNYFNFTSNTHEKYTRGSSCDNYFLPFYRNKKLQRSIKYQGPKTWNSLESSLKNCKSLKTFQFKLKHFISQKYTI